MKIIPSDFQPTNCQMIFSIITHLQIETILRIPLKFLGFKVTCDVKFSFIHKGKHKLSVAKATRKKIRGPNKLLSPLGTRFRRNVLSMTL